MRRAVERDFGQVGPLELVVTFGLLLSPILASAVLVGASVSVVSNGLRLARAHFV